MHTTWKSPTRSWYGGRPSIAATVFPPTTPNHPAHQLMGQDHTARLRREESAVRTDGFQPDEKPVTPRLTVGGGSQ